MKIMNNKAFLLYLICINVFSAYHVILQNEEGLWKMEEFINVVLDIDLTPIINKCLELKNIIFHMEDDVTTDQHKQMLLMMKAL
jgi:hypothetical protein